MKRCVLLIVLILLLTPAAGHCAIKPPRGFLKLNFGDSVKVVESKAKKQNWKYNSEFELDRTSMNRLYEGQNFDTHTFIYVGFYKRKLISIGLFFNSDQLYTQFLSALTSEYSKPKRTVGMYSWEVGMGKIEIELKRELTNPYGCYELHYRKPRGK